MFLLMIFSITSQFITINIEGKDNEFIVINVPKQLALKAFDFEEIREDVYFRFNEEKISSDSFVNIIRNADESDRPFLELEDNNDIIRFWVKDADEIILTRGKPRRITLDIEGSEDSVHLRFPLWMAKMIPSFLVGIYENTREIKYAELLIRETVKCAGEFSGGFVLIDKKDEDSHIKITFK